MAIPRDLGWGGSAYRGPQMIPMASVTDTLALWVLAARVAQSSTHLISTSNLAVNIRFAFFAVQLVVAVWWTIQFLVQWPAA